MLQAAHDAPHAMTVSRRVLHAACSSGASVQYSARFRARSFMHRHKRYSGRVMMTHAGPASRRGPFRRMLSGGERRGRVRGLRSTRCRAALSWWCGAEIRHSIAAHEELVDECCVCLFLVRLPSTEPKQPSPQPAHVRYDRTGSNTEPEPLSQRSVTDWQLGRLNPSNSALEIRTWYGHERPTLSLPSKALAGTWRTITIT